MMLDAYAYVALALGVIVSIAVWDAVANLGAAVATGLAAGFIFAIGSRRKRADVRARS